MSDYIKNNIIALKEWIKETSEGCPIIIGISGGTDSSVVAKLCVETVGKEKVIGILLPCGRQHDIDYAMDLVELLGLKYHVVNIGLAYEQLTQAISHEKPEVWKNTCYTTNTPARLRMASLYGFAALYGGRVINTCNKSEDYVGYSTKFGDSAGDFAPIAEFTKTEVREIGLALGLPDKFIEKIPEDGMSGVSDEEKLGFTYEVLDEYITTGKIDDQDTFKKIEDMHVKNLHKLVPMPVFNPVHLF